METYRFTDTEGLLMEKSPVPFAVYQFIDRRVVVVALSEGFCRLFGYEDRETAYYDMNNNMYKDTHPDDAARIADAAMRFATEDSSYDVVYRTRKKDGSGYRVIHASGEHVYPGSGVRLAYVWYTDEGDYTAGDSSDASDLSSSLDRALSEESRSKARYYDFLTGLPSMTYFFDLAQATCKTMLREGKKPALLYIDMVGMK